MTHPILLALLALLCGSAASSGDQLPQFQECCVECELIACPRDVHVHTNTPKGVDFGPIASKLDAIDDLIALYSQNSVNPVAQLVFHWDCVLDCNYKCQQIVHKQRKQEGLPAVKFYGKWPFRRVAGMTEFLLVVFSGANFYVNYINFRKMTGYYSSKKHNNAKAVMALQYCFLLGLLMLGWLFSAIFHIRDTKISETMDYLGAGSIVVANFNAIAVRYFDLHQKRLLRRLFQVFMVFMLCAHYARLHRHWDYGYNMNFSICMGLASVTLWILHSVRVNRIYRSSARVYADPYERRLLARLRYLGISRPRFVPFVPVLLNLYLLCSIIFEVHDFEPWFGLLDAHAVWHICTIFPPLLWYDWNIWDLELCGSVSK